MKYYLWLIISCKKHTKNINPKNIKTKNNKQVMLSKSSICTHLHTFKKPTFISQGSGLFDSLGLLCEMLLINGKL